MEEIKQITRSIMAEIENEVIQFLEQVGWERLEGVKLEREAREIGLKCGATVLERAIGLYGNGKQGERPSCRCPAGYGEMEFVRHDRVKYTSSTGQIEVRSAYYHCAMCKGSRWPVYERLGPARISHQGVMKWLFQPPFGKIANRTNAIRPDCPSNVTRMTASRVFWRCHIRPW